MRFLCVFLAVIAICGESRADPLYIQNFPGSMTIGGSNSALSNYNWASYFGSSATLAASGNGSSTANAMVSNGGTAPYTASNTATATTPANTTVTNGTPVLVTPSTSAPAFLLEQTAYIVSRANGDPQDFSWYAASQSSGDTQQLAIEVGSQWYVSNDVFNPTSGVTNASGLSGAKHIIEPFSTASNAFSTLNFTAGSQLSVGSPTQLLPGDIDGFGVYATSTASDKVFVDTFEVDSPEPASAVIVMPLLVFLRRRR